MADPFGRDGGGSGASDPFGRGSGGAKSKPGGVTGFVEHLGADVKDAALGFGPGIVHTFEHPGRTFHQLKQVYGDTYGHGFGHFAHSFYSHPFGPLMDALTLITLPFGIGEGFAGSRIAGGLGKMGAIDAEKGALVTASRRLGEVYRPYELRGARAILADGGKLKGVSKVVGDEGLAGILDRFQVEHHGTLPRRYVGTKIDELMKHAPAEWKMVGEIARYGRQEKLLLKQGPRALGLRAGEFTAALGKLSQEERYAVRLHLAGTSPEEYTALLQKIAAERGPTDFIGSMIAEMARPEIRDAYHSPRPIAQHAVIEGRRLAEELTKYRRADAKAAHAELTAGTHADHAEQIAAHGDAHIPDGLEPAAMTKLQRAHDKVTKQLEAKRDAQLAKHDEALATWEKILNERPWLHARVNRGARFKQSYNAPELERTQARAAKFQAQLEKLHETESLWHRDALAQAKKTGTPLPASPYADKIAALSSKLEQATTHQARLEKGLATRHAGGDIDKLHEMVNQSKRAPDEMVDTPASGIEAMRKEFADAGRPEPVYVPDMDLPGMAKGATVNLKPRGAGMSADALKNDKFMKQNHAALYMSGKLALDPASLGIAFKDYARRQYADALHGQLLMSAVENHGDLPSGWRWIKETASERLPRPGETLVETRGKGGETIQQMVEASLSKSGYSSETHLMVPESLISAMIESGARNDVFIRRLWETPTTVWRAMVLNLRLGWLTNNFIGQHMLLWFHYSGPDMMQAWISYFREARPKAASELEKLQQTREFRSITEKYASQEVRGQFRSQTPGLDPLDESPSIPTRAGRKFTEVTGKIANLNAKMSEDLPRDIALRTHVIREARKANMKISTEASKFNELAERILEQPHLASRAMTEADRALGDYTTLGSFEKKVVRQLIPFYSWLRAISKIVLNAAVDTPGRVAVATRIGTIGEEWVQEALNSGEPLPDYLKALVPLFGGVLNTKSASPYGSVPDVMDFLTALVHGKPGDAGRHITPSLSPFIQGGMEALTGKTAIGGEAEAPPKAFQGLFGDMLYKNATELPLVHLAIAAAGHGKDSKTFGPDTGLRELLNYLGVPVRPEPKISR